MKKLILFPMLLVIALLIAACGPADTEPGEGTPGIITPDVFVTPMETPVVPVTPETTAEVTPEMTVEVTPPATPETTPTGVEETPVAGVGANESPWRASNMLDYDVRNNEDETIGSIDELIVSMSGMAGTTNQQTTDDQQQTPASPDLTLGTGERISYVIVNVGGFLGIGQRQVAIPFEALQLQTGDDENDYAFYMDVSQDQLEALPEVDFEQIEFTDQNWDQQFRSSWDSGLATPAQQQTPAATDETPAAPVTTPAPTVNPDGTEQAGQQIYGLRVSVLLGSEVYDQVAVAPAQTTQQTPTPAEATPAAGTETPEGTEAIPGTEIPDAALVVATIEDLIVDPESGTIQYAVLDADDNLELGEVWIPVPMIALNIMGADDLLLGMGIEYLVQVDRQQLAEAPNFEVGALPVVEDPEWDAGVRDYWDIQ